MRRNVLSAAGTSRLRPLVGTATVGGRRWTASANAIPSTIYLDEPVTLMMLTVNLGTVVLPPIWVS